jgi:hypothetical protein
MRKYQLPDIEYLRQRLRYEPETGKLFWLAHQCQRPQWNSRFAGAEAFAGLNENGYLKGVVNEIPLKAHRVAYAIYHGSWPDGDVDHINGIRTDNRIDNLRVVSRSQNMRNAKRYKSNKTGITGVYWNKALRKYEAKIQIDKKQIHLGVFPTRELAAQARLNAERANNFHQNHGRAA